MRPVARSRTRIAAAAVAHLVFHSVRNQRRTAVTSANRMPRAATRGRSAAHRFALALIPDGTTPLERCATANHAPFHCFLLPKNSCCCSINPPSSVCSLRAPACWVVPHTVLAARVGRQEQPHVWAARKVLDALPHQDAAHAQGMHRHQHARWTEPWLGMPAHACAMDLGHPWHHA